MKKSTKQRTLKKSIFKKTVLSFAIPISIGMIIIMAITYINISADKQREIDDKNDMIAENLSERIDKYSLAVELNAQNPEIASLNHSRVEPHIQAFMQQEGEVWSHFLVTDETGVNVAHSEGEGSRGVSIADKSYFTVPWNEGVTHVSSPTFSNSTGRRILGIGAPTYDEQGNKSGVLVGFVRLEYLSEVVNAHTVTQNSYTFMLNEDGTLSSHPNDEIVLQQNWLSAPQGDTASAQYISSMSSGFKDVVAAMTSGQSGTAITTVDGQLSVVTYRPVGVGGLSIATVAPFFELYSVLIILLISIVAVILAACIINVFTSSKIADGITLPIVGLTNWGKKLAIGDVSHKKDDFLQSSCVKEVEIVQLVESFEQTSNGIQQNVDIMSEVAAGNLTVDIVVRDENDMLSKALFSLVQQLNTILQNIKLAALQVTSGSEQIAESSQSLAEGSMSQSSAIEQLNSSAGTMKEQFEITSVSVTDITQKLSVTQSELESTLSQLNVFIDEIGIVNTKSSEISNIVKTIEDISFQTNILALNAAVEAARAGAAGKGFAVVADEVRNLASKSAQAAKETSVLIEETVSSISKVNSNAQGTIVFMDNLKDMMSQTMSGITEISGTIEQELQLVTEIAGSIDKITSVVHLNSATSEETAAGSEELSSQSNHMQSLIAGFTIKEGSTTAALPPRGQTTQW